MGGVRECLPSIAMVLVQLGFAGLSVLSKLALDTGMSPYVLVAYRNLIAAVFLAPVAFFLERQARMAFTKKVLFQIFLCSIFGATTNQALYFLGLKYTTPTIACALTNTLPAITFIMAAALKMETVRIATRAGQAKVVGTVICVGGSMIMTFYKGPLIRVWAFPVQWRYAAQVTAAAAERAGGYAAVLGDILIILACISWAVWFLIQKKVSKNFNFPYTSTALMSLMAGVNSTIISAAVERSISVWALGFDFRLLCVLYAGIVVSGMAVALMSWCIQIRGPVYTSMFSLLLLVIVAVLGWAILDEKIRRGSAIGSVLIVVGLYMVLWGKGEETSATGKDAEMNGLDVNGNHPRGGESTSLTVDSTANHRAQSSAS